MYGRFLLKQPVYQNGKDENEVHVIYFSTKFVFASRLNTIHLARNYLCVMLSFHAVSASNDCCTE